MLKFKVSFMSIIYALYQLADFGADSGRQKEIKKISIEKERRNNN